MIIKNVVNAVAFSDILLGQTFRWEGKICMAVEFVADEEGEVNSVDLSNGDLLYIKDYEEVEIVKGYFQVE